MSLGVSQTMFTPADNNVYSGPGSDITSGEACPSQESSPQSVTDSCHQSLVALVTLQQAVIVGVDIEDFTSNTFPTLHLGTGLAGLTVGLGYCMGKYRVWNQTDEQFSQYYGTLM